MDSLCMSVCLHAHQEGWIHSASLAWIQIGSLLQMFYCRDIGEGRGVINEALYVTVWEMRRSSDREKESEDGEGTCGEMSGMNRGKKKHLVSMRAQLTQRRLVIGQCCSTSCCV